MEEHQQTWLNPTWIKHVLSHRWVGTDCRQQMFFFVVFPQTAKSPLLVQHVMFTTLDEICGIFNGKCSSFSFLFFFFNQCLDFWPLEEDILTHHTCPLAAIKATLVNTVAFHCPFLPRESISIVILYLLLLPFLLKAWIQKITHGWSKKNLSIHLVYADCTSTDLSWETRVDFSLLMSPSGSVLHIYLRYSSSSNVMWSISHMAGFGNEDDSDDE